MNATLGDVKKDGHAAVPRRIFGFEVYERADGWLPVERDDSVLIIDEASDYCVAELVGNNLIVFHKLYGHADADFEIYAALLDRVVAARQMSLEQRLALRQERLKKALEKSRAAYVQFCSKKRDKELAEGKAQMNEARTTVEASRRRYTEAIRAFEDLHQQIAFLENDTTELAQKSKEEFDELLAWPKVEGARISDAGSLSVFTDVLYCDDPRTGKTHEIGKFRIVIDMVGGEVRWYNLTRLVKGYDSLMFNAPHVDGNGKGCLGTAKTAIAEMIAHYEFVALVSLAIQFIESVNVDRADERWGPYIDKWPVAKKKKTPVKETGAPVMEATAAKAAEA
jgi:hypothetical protein